MTAAAPSARPERDAVPCPEITTYQLVSGPGGAPWLARYAISKVHPKTGAEWIDFLPMIFQGSSREAVVAVARQFWADEQRKIEGKRAHFVKLGAASKRRAAAWSSSGSISARGSPPVSAWRVSLAHLSGPEDRGMIDWRKVGQAVVCTNDQYDGGGWMGTALVDAVYIIREVKWPPRSNAGKALFRFVGYRWLNAFGEEMWEPDWRYRPVEHRKADLSAFETILDRVNKREVVDA